MDPGVRTLAFHFKPHPCSLTASIHNTLPEIDNDNPSACNPYPAGQLWARAYDVALAYQTRAPDARTSSGMPPIVCARVVGYMLIHAPTNKCRNIISNEIENCEDDSKLCRLAELYAINFVRCCRSILCASVVF